jgi:hypothetical protein
MCLVRDDVTVKTLTLLSWILHIAWLSILSSNIYNFRKLPLKYLITMDS